MTGPAVGTQVQFSTGVELTYGTPVVTDRFHEILSETLKRRNRVLQSNGLRGGVRNLRRGSRRVVTGREAAGDVVFEVPTTTFGRLFNQITGGTPTIVQQGATPAYLHTYPLGSVLGKAMTLQKVLRDASGAVIQTLTYPGSKVVSAEFSISVDQILQLTVIFDSQDERADIAAAAASYATVRLFHFAEASLTVAGVAAANLKDARVRLDNQQDVARFYLGNRGLKQEPTDSNFPDVSGTFTGEVLDAALYNLFVADTAAALSLKFVGDTISGAYRETLEIVVPEIHIEGDSPAVSGPGVIERPAPWRAAADSASDPGLSILYTSTDAAA